MDRCSTVPLLPVRNWKGNFKMTYLRAPWIISNFIAYLGFSAKVHFLCNFFSWKFFLCFEKSYFKNRVVWVEHAKFWASIFFRNLEIFWKNTYVLKILIFLWVLVQIWGFWVEIWASQVTPHGSRMHIHTPFDLGSVLLCFYIPNTSPLRGASLTANFGLSTSPKCGWVE